MADRTREQKETERLRKGVFQPSRAEIAEEMKARLHLRQDKRHPPKTGR